MNTERTVWDMLLDNKTACVVVIIILGFVSLSGKKKYNEFVKERERLEAAAQREVEAQERQAEFERKTELANAWTLGPQPPTPELGTAPEVPLPLPPPFESMTPQQEYWFAQARLEQLIINHPEDDIRVDLHADIVQGEPLINMQQMGNGHITAAFMYMPLSMIAWVEDGAISKPMAALNVNPVRLLDMETVEDMLRMMLVISHEDVHYTHWQEADEDSKAYFFPAPKEQKMSEGYCLNKWQTEYEAYKYECELGLSWGITDSMEGLCLLNDDEEEFNKYLFAMEGKAHGSATGCTAIWAREAGHPHWEVFL